MCLQVTFHKSRASCGAIRGRSHKQRLEDSAPTTLRVPGRTMCKQVHCRDRLMHCSALPAFVPFEDSMA